MPAAGPRPASRWSGPCFALAVLLSLVVLFSPEQAGPSGPPGSDKVVHGLLFALLAATTRWRFGPRGGALAVVAAYAPASELVQHLLLPHRTGDVRDVGADLVGVSLGWLLARRLTAGRATAA